MREPSEVLAPASAKFVGDVFDQGAGVDMAEDGRGLAHRDGTGAEGFEDKAQLGEVLGPIKQKQGAVTQFDDFGDQERLRGDAVPVAGGLEPFVDKAFVGGVGNRPGSCRHGSGRR